MSYKFNKNNYDADRASKPKSSLPDAGSIVLVRLISESDAGFEWCGTKETKSKAGRAMLQVHCMVEKGYRGEGCWMLDYILLDNEYTDQRVGALLDATGHDMSKAQTFALDAKRLCGKHAYVRVKHEDYEGEPRARVAYWIVPSQYDNLGLANIHSDDSGPIEKPNSDEKLPF